MNKIVLTVAFAALLTGAAAADTVRADATVTMIVPKPGLLAPEGALLCGRVRVAPLAYIEPLLEAESLAS